MAPPNAGKARPQPGAGLFCRLRRRGLPSPAASGTGGPILWGGPGLDRKIECTKKPRENPGKTAEFF